MSDEITDSIDLEKAEGQAEVPQTRPDPVRQRLEDTRSSITHHFKMLCGQGKETEELDGYIIVDLYEDGQPGEVFIKIAKQGSTISGLMNTVAILTSIALQHGVPVEALSRKLEHVRFEPSGRTHNPNIRMAKSVVDYMFRWLGQEFSAEYRDQKAGLDEH